MLARLSRAIAATDVRYFSSCRCSSRTNVVKTGAAFALQPLSLEDRLHLGECLIDIVIDDDVIVFRPMAHFVAGAAHPSADHLIGVLCAGVKPLFKIGGRRRQDEDADNIRSRLFPQLLGALPVDVEQHVLSRRQARPRPARAACHSDCRTRWPIRAIRHALPSVRIWTCRQTDSRGHRLRRAASAAWSRTPTSSGRASVRSTGATAWSFRRPTAMTARTSVRAAQPRRSRGHPAVMPHSKF